MVTDFLGTQDGATYYVKRISGLWQRYDLGNGHPLVGATMPDLRLDDGTRLCDHAHEGRALLVDLAGDDRLAALAKRYAGRVELVRGRPTTAPTATPRISAMAPQRPRRRGERPPGAPRRLRGVGVGRRRQRPGRAWKPP